MEIKKKRGRPKKKQVCVRCSSMPSFQLNMGNMGYLPVCQLCWLGMALSFKKDFDVWDTDPAMFQRIGAEGLRQLQEFENKK